MPPPTGSNPAEARLHPSPRQAASTGLVTAVVVALVVAALLGYIALV
jgi:hypothetical protein